MAILAMCFHNLDPAHTEYSRITYETFLKTVDFSRYVLGVFDNASTDPGTRDLLKRINGDRHYVRASIINVGTAAGINSIWKRLHQNPVPGVLGRGGQAVCKLDNDWTFAEGISGDGWLEEALEVFERDPSIGVVGLKRTDLQDVPGHDVIPWVENPDMNIPATQLRMLPQPTGLDRWLVVEEAAHVMGTAQVISPQLLEAIGYLVQPGLYGFDDSLLAVRANVAGFKSAFLPHLSIRHLDPGVMPYQQWKVDVANIKIEEYFGLRAAYETGVRPVYYDGGF